MRDLLRKSFSKTRFDFQETFSPVVKSATVRIVLAIALTENGVLEFDINKPFLHGDITEEVYMLKLLVLNSSTLTHPL